MARIVIVPEIFEGTVQTISALARKLQRQGHEIYFLRPPDDRDAVVAEGFQFIEIFSDIWPKGLAAAEAAEEAATKKKKWNPKRVGARLHRRMEAILDGAVEKAVASVKPDLFIVDMGSPLMAMAARALNVPVLQFELILLSTEDPSVPPLRSSLLPAPGLGFRLRNRLAWRLARVRRWLKRFVVWNEGEAIRRVARATHLPPELIDESNEFSPRLKLPTIVLCPQAFDLPRTKTRPEVTFVEPLIDFERQSSHIFLDWNRSDERPLIYCALGGMATRIFPDRAVRALQSFMDAIEQRPQWRGLVAVGKLEAKAFRVPSNVQLVARAPQLDVLRQANVMVTHGGISSVKECIYFGVPMLALPMFFDQFGYAARVEYHQIGLRGSANDPPETFLKALDTLTRNNLYRQNISKLSKIFIEEEEKSPSLKIVEQLLQSAR